jgi:hypothetical protein
VPCTDLPHLPLLHVERRWQTEIEILRWRLAGIFEFDYNMRKDGRGSQFCDPLEKDHENEETQTSSGDCPSKGELVVAARRSPPERGKGPDAWELLSV